MDGYHYGPHTWIRLDRPLDLGCSRYLHLPLLRLRQRRNKDVSQVVDQAPPGHEFSWTLWSGVHAASSES